MTRRIMLFGAMFFVGLTAGAAFVVSFHFNPSGSSPQFYVENMQHAIRELTIPLPTVVMSGLVFTVLSAALAWGDRTVRYLLIAASLCVLGVALITAFGNIPINNQIMTWSVNAPPSNWSELALKWSRLQIARTAFQLLGLALLTAAVLIRCDMSR